MIKSSVPQQSPLSLSEQDITKVLDEKFRWLRFPTSLEAAYRAQKEHRLRSRAVSVALAAFFLNLAYVMSDFFLLPDDVGGLTVGIRTGILLPLVTMVLVLGYLQIAPRLFFGLYYLAYLIGGLSVIGISVIAQLHSLAIPYEGLLLIMMFGYLVMGIPFYHALSGALFLFLVYVLAQLWLGLSPMTMLYNTFFIITANFIGAIGCYMQEHGDRRNYLNSLLLGMSRDRAETESERKTRLLAEASHDLRQPLHAMTLTLEGLSSQNLSTSSQNMLVSLKTALANLNRMLVTLLDMSSIETGGVKASFSDFDLSLFLKELVAEFHHMPVRLEVAHAETSEVLVVRSDKVLLARLLRNLVDNACKHAQASEVVIRLDVSPGKVTLMVEDDGCGMDEETKLRVFDPFYRNASHDADGLGLGLAIVKELSGLLELDLQLESQPGKGTRFSISFALVSARASLSAAVNRRVSVQQGHVLIADDDEVIVDALKTLLTGWGYTVSCVFSFDALRQSLQQPLPDLLISDAHFREGGPSDRARSVSDLLPMILRQDVDLPILVITGDTRLQRDNFDYRSLELMYKPVAPAKLRMVVLTLIERASGQ